MAPFQLIPRSFAFRVLLPLFLVFTLFCASGIADAPMDIDTKESPELTVQFEKPLFNAADDLIRSYPAVKDELEKTFGWPVDFRPLILLVKEGSRFREITGNDMIVAFAIPRQHF